MIILIICPILLISCLTWSHCMFNGHERYLRMNRETSWPEIWCWVGLAIPTPTYKKMYIFAEVRILTHQGPSLWPSGRASLCEGEAETSESRRGGAFGRIMENEETGRCLWHQWQDGDRWAMKECELCPMAEKSLRHVQWDDFITFLCLKMTEMEKRGILLLSLSPVWSLTPCSL